MQGLLKVNWKKGLNALNINNSCDEHSNKNSSNDEYQSYKDKSGICQTKKKGAGRY